MIIERKLYQDKGQEGAGKKESSHKMLLSQSKATCVGEWETIKTTVPQAGSQGPGRGNRWETLAFGLSHQK